MAETIRDIQVHLRIEVDTNKQTYVLDRDGLDLTQMETEAADFAQGLGLTLRSQELLDIALDTLKRIASGDDTYAAATAEDALDAIRAKRNED